VIAGRAGRSRRPHDQGGRAEECTPGHSEPLHHPPECVRRQEHEEQQERSGRVAAQALTASHIPDGDTAARAPPIAPPPASTGRCRRTRRPPQLPTRFANRAGEKCDAGCCADSCDQPAPDEGEDHPERAPPVLSNGGHGCRRVAASSRAAAPRPNPTACGLLGARSATAGGTAGGPSSTGGTAVIGTSSVGVVGHQGMTGTPLAGLGGL
jgi:hypothetical protein